MLPARAIKRLATALLFMIFWSLVPQHTYAAELSVASVRLDRTKANSALSGLVCAIPSTAAAGVENTIQVTFPSDFTISTTATNWTTSTGNLPSDATAWPGIGVTANSVSGNSVSFASSDLTSTAKYCFHFTASGSATGSIGSKSGLLKTLNNSSTIDSQKWGVTVVTSDQVTVSGTVSSGPSDYEVVLEKNTEGDTFNQNETIQYKLNYGTELPYPSPITVVATWTRGTVLGNPNPTVDVLDYVIGSASNAYSSTAPVIDTENRTIAWTITNFPANTTDQFVTFRLRTTENYTGSTKVGFSVSGYIEADNTQSAQSKVNATYIYQEPEATSNLVATATPTGTPTPAPLAIPTFDSVHIRTIDSTSATIDISTSPDSELIISYGTSLSNLSQTLRTSGYGKRHQIPLDGLNPETRYYFKITAISRQNTRLTSDTFTFSTAEVSVAPSARPETLIVTTKNNIIFSALGVNADNQAVLPGNTPFQFRISMLNSDGVYDIQAFIQNHSVLGISTADAIEHNLSQTNLIEIEKGVFLGQLQITQQGFHAIYLRIKDYQGNIIEQKIADVKISTPLQVVTTDRKPVENAKIYLQYLNPRSKIFEPISSQILNIPNPSFTDHRGILEASLPIGIYRAEISGFGIKSSTVDFELRYDAGYDYPVIIAGVYQMTILGYLQYFLDTALDTIREIQATLANFAVSNRFFELIAFGILTSVLLLSLVSFSSKFHVPFYFLPKYMLHQSKYLLTKRNNLYPLTGIVTDGVKPLAGVESTLINIHSHKVMAIVKSSAQGKFLIPNIPLGDYKLELLKQGYLTSSIPVTNIENQSKMTIELNQHESFEHKLQSAFSIAIRHIMSSLYELLLITSLILEILFVPTFGLAKTMPFIVLSTLNLLLWFNHLKHSKELAE